MLVMMRGGGQQWWVVMDGGDGAGAGTRAWWCWMLGWMLLAAGSPGVVPFQIGLPRSSKQVQLELDVGLGYFGMQVPQNWAKAIGSGLFFDPCGPMHRMLRGVDLRWFKHIWAPVMVDIWYRYKKWGLIEVRWFYASWFIHFAGWNWILWENPVAACTGTATEGEEPILGLLGHPRNSVNWVPNSPSPSVENKLI